jgi:hypothetical protein
MHRRPRPRRVAIRGARVPLANTLADLVNVSRTGVLMQVGYELPPGSEWPLTLAVPTRPWNSPAGSCCASRLRSRPGDGLLTLLALFTLVDGAVAPRER